MCLLHDYFPITFVTVNTITQFGATVGAFTLPVIVERSLEAYGYNGAFLILGGICLNALPLAVALRPRNNNGSSEMEQGPREESQGELHEFLEEETDNSVENNNSQTLGNVNTSEPLLEKVTFLSFLRTKLKTSILCEEPLYMLAVPVYFLASYIIYAWMLCLVPYAEWLGIETSRAVFLSSIAGISGIFGKLFFVFCLHLKIDTILFFCFLLPPFALTFFINSINASFAYQAVMAAVQGFMIFAFEGLSPNVMKLSIKKESNMPSAIALFLPIYGSGIMIGDLISGEYYNNLIKSGRLSY